MKKLTMAALLLASACGLAQAGGSASATMDVSFVIRAACTVQAEGGAAPEVACSQGTGYQLVRPEAAERQSAPPPSSAGRSGDAWLVVF